MPARTFAAIGLPQATLDLLEDAGSAFRASSPDWAQEKWVRRDALHVTVAFLGAVADDAVPDVLAGMRAACRQVEVPLLTLAGLHAAPSRRRARMVWATLRDRGDECAALAAAVERELIARIGHVPQRHAFTPHVTLVRARATRAVEAGALSAGGDVIEAGKEADRSVSVRSVTLYASTLGPSGPTYEQLGSAKIGER